MTKEQLTAIIDATLHLDIIHRLIPLEKSNKSIFEHIHALHIILQKLTDGGLQYLIAHREELKEAE